MSKPDQKVRDQWFLPRSGHRCQVLDVCNGLVLYKPLWGAPDVEPRVIKLIGFKKRWRPLTESMR